MLQRIFIILLLTLMPALTLADQLIIEPEMGRTPILKCIKEAKQSINLVMYGFTDKTLLDALLQQKARERTVQVILERAPYKSQAQNRAAILAFQKANIAWQGAIPNFRLIHQKTLITDKKEALVMTFNFTHSSFKNDRNFALLVEDPKLVNEIDAVFAADWNHVPMTQHSPDLLYSPDDSREKLTAMIRSAKSSIKIYAQSISDYQIIGALANSARKGVQVSILLSKQPHPKQIAYLQRAGVHLHQSERRYIHAKVFIFDDNMAVIGSINLTQASLDTNRELSVVTRDKTVLKQLTKQFEIDRTA